jgi:GNAT superfamily N-acetyltransferase
LSTLLKLYNIGALTGRAGPVNTITTTYKMITFKDLSPEQWSIYADHILEAEKNFPENIQSTEKDFINALSKEVKIARIIFYNDEFAGLGICFPFTEDTITEFEIDDTPPEPEAMYLYSIVVRGDLQGKGIGMALLKDLIDTAKKMGFKYFVGHYRPNGSLTLIRKMGATEIRNYPNWGDSGEEYVYCRLQI